MFAAGIIPPLLAKELIELAAARRTYVLRVLYALGMFGLFIAVFARQFLAMQAGRIEVFGEGGKLFDAMVWWQFAGIYLFLPVLVAPMIPLEEQRGNLDLLLVSGVGPAELLFQKLLSRLITMGGFLLLALPIAGLAYTLGGVGVERIGAAVVCLAFAAIQVGCVALWCSAKYASPLRALIICLLLGPLILFVVLPMAVLLAETVLATLMRGYPRLGSEPYAMSAMPPWLYGQAVRGFGYSPLATAWFGLPCLLSALFFFWRAWRALKRRSTTMSKTMLEQMALHRPERRYELHRRQRVVALGRDRVALPDDQPLAWRERRRTMRIFGTPEQRSVVIGICVSLFTLFMIVAWSGRSDSGRTAPAVVCSALLQFTLAGAAPLAAVLAAGLISGERAHSSLPLLLVSPLTTRELLRQKLAGVDRLVWLALALIGVLGLAGWSIDRAAARPELTLYLPATALTAWLYLRLAAWIGLAISLRVREPIPAAVTALGVVVAWAALPIVGWELANDLGAVRLGSESWQMPLFLLSPIRMVVINEAGKDPQWLAHLALNSACYGGLLAALRWWTLRRADALLGRVA